MSSRSTMCCPRSAATVRSIAGPSACAACTPHHGPRPPSILRSPWLHARRRAYRRGAGGHFDHDGHSLAGPHAGHASLAWRGHRTGCCASLRTRQRRVAQRTRVGVADFTAGWSSVPCRSHGPGRVVRLRRRRLGTVHRRVSDAAGAGSARRGTRDHDRNKPVDPLRPTGGHGHAGGSRGGPCARRT